VADPTEDFPVGETGIRKMGSLVPHKVDHLFREVSISIPSGLENTQKRWLNLRESENENHGSLVALLMASATSAEGSITFQVELDWTVEFSSPDLPTLEVDTDIYCQAGYEGYFTDSVSDWAGGTKLTLKHKEGGSAVPFPDAEPGIVYQLHPKATLYYTNQSGGEESRIGYGVRIPNYPIPAFAVFDRDPASDGLSRATAFAHSGDSNFCTPYKAAGKASISPDNPPWSQRIILRASAKESNEIPVDLRFSQRIGHQPKSSPAPPVGLSGECQRIQDSFEFV